jgi:hypothetical protein
MLIAVVMDCHESRAAEVSQALLDAQLAQNVSIESHNDPTWNQVRGDYVSPVSYHGGILNFVSVASTLGRNLNVPTSLDLGTYSPTRAG